MKVSEIDSLTGVRGLAALYVIVHHWFVLFARQHLNQPNVDSSPLSLYNILKHGYLSVDLFFVLSGFVLSLSVYKKFQDSVSFHNWTAFMQKRFLRIFPLYIAITLLYFFVFGPSNPLKLLVNLTLLQGIVPSVNSSIIPPGCSLTNEWVMYLAFPFIFYLIHKLKSASWLLLLLAAFTLVLTSEIRSPMFNWGNYPKLKDVEGFNPIINFTRGPASFLRTIAAYILGIFAFMMYQKNKKLPSFKYLVIPLFLLFFYKETDILIILAIPFFIIYITGNNMTSRFLSSKPVYFLGLISYSLYVNHYLFLQSYGKVSQLLGFDSAIVYFTYTLLGTFIFSCITYYLIEKPGLALFKKRSFRFGGGAVNAS